MTISSFEIPQTEFWEYPFPKFCMIIHVTIVHPSGDPHPTFKMLLRPNIYDSQIELSTMRVLLQSNLIFWVSFINNRFRYLHFIIVHSSYL